MEYEVAFTRSCLYKMEGIDKRDINKLFGFSFGYHETNSVRFGWRSEGGKIELSVYLYKNGKRETQTIGLVEIDNIYIFEIVVLKGFIVFRVKTDLGTILINVQTSRVKGACSWGYELFPYFGEKRTAPQNIELYMRRSK